MGSVRILYHHRVASRDGQAVHIEELVAALRRRGHEVLVVGPATVEAVPVGGEVAWVARLRRHLPKALWELLEPGWGLWATLRLLRAAREFRPDLIYERYALYLPAGVVAARFLGRPLLLEVNAPLAEERATHGGLLFPDTARRIERWIWRRADRIVAVSRVLAEIVAAGGVEPGRVRVVPNAVNLEAFHGLDRQAAKRALGLDGHCVLGFLGFVRDWHGLDRAIRFLAAHPDPRLQLVVAGDGPARPGLEALATILGIGHRVRFLGAIARDRVPQTLAAFDIALQPAVVGYASPLKLFEYMAAGCAILAPDTPNIREVVRDGVEALLFSRGAFDHSLLRLVHDPALRERLGAAARARIYELDRSWDANARVVEKLARELGVLAATSSHAARSSRQRSCQR